MTTIPLKSDPTDFALSADLKARGYAHFPGTGPDGLSCRRCRHGAPLPGTKIPRTVPGQVAPPLPTEGVCEKARELAGRRPPILLDAPCCRYFEAGAETAWWRR